MSQVAPPFPPRRIAAPRPPELPPPARLPLIATIAPLAVSLLLWLVTGSAMALVFAALGPVIGLATAADARIQRRRTRGREFVRFAGECDRVRAEVHSAHEEQRAALRSAAPELEALLSDLPGAPARWAAKPDAALPVRVGIGAIASPLRYDSPTSAGDASVEARLAQLRDLAAELPGAPISVEAAGGIGLVGPEPMTLSVARAIVLRLAIALSPSSVALQGAAALDSEDWLSALPHATQSTGRGGDNCLAFVAVAEEAVDGAAMRIARAPTIAELPRGLAVVIEVDGCGQGRLIRSPEQRMHGPLWPEFVGRESAAAAAHELARCARAEGIPIRRATELPNAVRLGELPQSSNGSGLACALGIGRDGVVSVDLVADGPHAIVGGTTGSGKSELLLSWVLGMAATRGPESVTFLFVDFKGGAAFEPLRALPHCVGVITDLDDVESARALASLGAELRRRERLLADRGLRSIDDASSPPFPRLVIVVDEYAAVVEGDSGLHAAFADLAARGRSLGIHLILCTQRPAGVVRERILANCSLRLCLRVTSDADSTAVIGTSAAANLPVVALGRALVSVAGAKPQAVQVAHSTRRDVREVEVRWSSAPKPRVPWLPPLARSIPVPPLAPDATVSFGMLDRPDAQSQEVARYDPKVHGSLLVVGAAGAGKSGALAALAAAPSLVGRELVASTVPSVWDALTGLLAARPEHDPGGVPRLLMIDDLDSVVAACHEDHAAELLDRLARVLRDGPVLGCRLVLTAQTVGSTLHSVLALCGSTLLLRMPSRAEFLAAGGEVAGFDPALPPGGGVWRGSRVQVFDAPRANVPPAVPESTLVRPGDGHPLAVVSTNPRRLVERLGTRVTGRRVTLLGDRQPGEPQPELRADGSDILVADVDTWQSHWALLSAVRRGSRLLFDGCSPADVRALTRVRELPPPFARGERPLWLLDPDGELTRARLQ